MTRELVDSFARSMEADREVVPYLPELLADLWDMGCALDVIVEVLRPLGLPAATTRVLDLGCGKGAVGITLAAELGIRCVGIDICEAFLAEARRRAAENGVADRCEFRHGDIRDAVRNESDHDIVVYASLGDVLGEREEQVRRLRATVREGGHIVIDDGFLKVASRLDRPGYESYRRHDETVEALQSAGDRLVTEVVLADARTSAINEGYLKAIRGRAAVTIEQRPAAATAIEAYVRGQEEECRVIDQHLASAVWLLQRRDTRVAI